MEYHFLGNPCYVSKIAPEKSFFVVVIVWEWNYYEVPNHVIKKFLTRLLRMCVRNMPPIAVYFRWSRAAKAHCVRQSVRIFACKANDELAWLWRVSNLWSLAFWSSDPISYPGGEREKRTRWKTGLGTLNRPWLRPLVYMTLWQHVIVSSFGRVFIVYYIVKINCFYISVKL